MALALLPRRFVSRPPRIPGSEVGSNERSAENQLSDEKGADSPGHSNVVFTERLLDLITTCVVTADAKGRVSFANRSALETLQSSLPLIVGKDLIELFRNSEEIAAALDDLEEGKEKRIDFSWPSGGASSLNMGMTLLRVGAMAPPDMHTVLLFRDLANVRLLEQEVRRVERLSSLGKMMAGLAHEIRNPLTGLQCLAESLLNETAADDPRREYAIRMQSLVDRVERLIRTALHFGEPRAPEKRVVAPEAMLASALEAMGSRWGDRWPTIDTESDVPRLEVDPAQIVECLMVLVDNALDAASQPSGVHLRLRCDATPGLIEGAARAVRIDVVDDGAGILPGQLARLFDPFYTTKAKGTGLGLSIAQSLTRENGGRILVQSTPGSGSVFSLVLPVPNR